MGERKEDVSVASSSRNNSQGDGRKRKADSQSDDSEIISLPEGWEIRHSRSRNGKVFYVNTISKVSTWKRPREGSTDQTRLAFEEGAKLKQARNHAGTKQPSVLATKQLKEKQLLPEMTVSVHPDKRKVEPTASAGPPSNKVQKCSAVSTVQNESQCQKYQKNKTRIENRETPIARNSSEKQITVGSCDSDKTKDKKHLFNNKTMKQVLTSPGQQTDIKLTRQILQPNRKTSKLDCSQNSKNSGTAGEIKGATSLNNSSTGNQKTAVGGLNPVPFTLYGVKFSVKRSQGKNCSPSVSSYLDTTTKSAPKLVASNANQGKINQSLQRNNSSHGSDPSYHQGAGGTKQNKKSNFLQHNNGSHNNKKSHNQGTGGAKQNQKSQFSQLTRGFQNREESHNQGTDTTKQNKKSQFLQHNNGSHNNEKSHNQGTGGAKQNQKGQFLQRTSGSHNSEENYHQGSNHHLNNINMGLPPQTSLAQTTYSYSFSNSPSPTCVLSKITDVSKSLTSGNSHSNSRSLNGARCGANDSLFKSPYDARIRSPDSADWRMIGHTANSFLDPESGRGNTANSSGKSANTLNVSSGNTANSSGKSANSLNVSSGNTANSSGKSANTLNVSSSNSANISGKSANSLNVSSGNTANSLNVSSVWSPSPSATEEEQDIEDMEVDEGLALLCSLQDVRTQASSMRHEPEGVLTEALTRAKSLDKPSAVDSTRDELKKKVILVVDTNVFISCLKFLPDIMDRQIPGYDGVMLVMPWVVMQELDYLKNNKRSSINNLTASTAARASKAIRFIHSHIIEKNSQLVGQTPQEAAEKTDLPLESNDDRILQCCLQFEQKYPDSLVVLLTKDMNLTNKAVIMGITAASNETLLSRLKVAKIHPGNEQGSSPTGKQNKKNKKVKNKDVKSADPKFNTGAETVLNTDTTPVRLKMDTTPVQLKMDTTPVQLKMDTTPIRLKMDTSQGCETSTTVSVPKTPLSTPVRLVSREANLALPDEILPIDTPTSKVSAEMRRLPQSEADKVAVINKFEAVWKLIHDMKSQIREIIAIGKSHANYAEAVQLLHRLKPLLSALNDDFSRCLYLSPVILWEHEAEFVALCTRLNTFYAEAQISCVDLSQQVQPVQLLKHFSDSGNRSVLFSGLEQLASFITDVETLLQACS